MYPNVRETRVIVGSGRWSTTISYQLDNKEEEEEEEGGRRQGWLRKQSNKPLPWETLGSLTIFIVLAAQFHLCNFWKDTDYIYIYFDDGSGCGFKLEPGSFSDQRWRRMRVAKDFATHHLISQWVILVARLSSYYTAAIYVDVWYKLEIKLYPCNIFKTTFLNIVFLWNLLLSTSFTLYYFTVALSLKIEIAFSRPRFFIVLVLKILEGPSLKERKVFFFIIISSSNWPKYCMVT